MKGVNDPNVHIEDSRKQKGLLTEKARLRTFDLLINITCSVKNVNNFKRR
jgi:hypothetical protein